MVWNNDAIYCSIPYLTHSLRSRINNMENIMEKEMTRREEIMVYWAFGMLVLYPFLIPYCLYELKQQGGKI